ncbi:MAG: hypothetical protein Q9201_001171 [Fulgogasparrea decipioides]
MTLLRPSKQRIISRSAIPAFALPLADADDNKYFQLDVHLCKPGLSEWETTVYTYGDLWRILGMAANRLGFAINNTGLHLWAAEIDETHLKDSLFHLTSRPEEVMDFLGLETERCGKAFDDLDQILTWATSSRIFRRRYFENQKTNTRSTKTERPMYLQFVTHWLPQHPDVGVSDEDKSLSRAVLTEEALDKFNKREECQSMIERHQKRLMKELMWRRIARALPLQGGELGKAIVALKASLPWRDATPELYADTQAIDRVSVLDEQIVDDVILPWVLEHWKRAVEFAEKADVH